MTNPDQVIVPTEQYRALLDLYAGMKDASENGTGYSPIVATAMKKLKELGVK